MKTHAQLQAQLDTAFDNYLELTALLHKDMESMLLTESNSQQWRRNFIRASAALLEGEAHGLREMCLVGLRCNASTLTKKERSAITDERGSDANNRLKLTLRAAYKLFSLQPAPDFGGTEWVRAQRVLRKRHRLMHPRRPRDLGMSDRTWSEMRRSTGWLMKQFVDFLSLGQQKHDG
ncbi:MAG: hypothetical protein ACREIG_05765 [Nitrospiraceae bacterium]